MIEILMFIGCVVFVYRAAESDGKSGAAWGGLTVLLCIFSLTLPWPVIRAVVPLVVGFLAMFIHNCVTSG